MASLDIEQQSGCSLDMYWAQFSTLVAKHTHTGRWLLCSGDTDAVRPLAPMGRVPASWLCLTPAALRSLFGGGGENNAAGATQLFILSWKSEA